MNTIAYDPPAGLTIIDACTRAIDLAISRSSLVSFAVNDVSLTASPTSTVNNLYGTYIHLSHENAVRWEASAEGKAVKAADKARLISSQNRVNALMAKLTSVYTNERKLMAWLGDLAECADHIGLKWDRDRLLKLLVKAGYRAGDAIDLDKAEYRKPRVMARYVIGNVIDCLERGMPPHPVTIRFVQDYQSLSQ